MDAHPNILTPSREIEECSEFLRRMSTQWETARHCHLTLSLLLTKIKEIENDPDPGMSSHSYALRNTERANDSLKPPSLHEQDLRKAQGRSRSQAEQPHPTVPGAFRGSEGPGIGLLASEHPTNFHTDIPSTEISPPHILGFQNMETNYLAGGSSFDLNMVDLFGGSNFDSLLDVIGQQYPNF